MSASQKAIDAPDLGELLVEGFRNRKKTLDAGQVRPVGVDRSGASVPVAERTKPLGVTG